MGLGDPAEAQEPSAERRLALVVNEHLSAGLTRDCAGTILMGLAVHVGVSLVVTLAVAAVQALTSRRSANTAR